MSVSTSPKTSEKPPILPFSVFVLAVVLTRVWYVAEQLRTHVPSNMSTHWMDASGRDHTITLSTSPGGSIEDFLVEYERALDKAQRQYPRKP